MATEDFREKWRRTAEALRREPLPYKAAGMNWSETGTAIDTIEQAPEPIWASGESKMTWARPNPTSYTSSHPTADTLPPGLYRPERTNNGLYLVQVDYKNDDIVYLPDNASNEVMEEIAEFWGKHAEFNKRGLVHKRGALLHGPQGSGKTSTIAQLIKINVEEHNGVAMHLDHPEVAASALQMIRRIEPRRPVICILEDLDALIQRHGESQYLALLDGESQIDHVVFIATTNYPEHLDKRVTNRPSRFDLVREIPPPSREGRAAYILAKESDISDADLQIFLEQTEGYSIAHLREFVILVKIFGKTVAEARQRLDKMRDDKPSSDQHDDGVRGTRMGFGTGQSDKRLVRERPPKFV